MPQPTLEGRWLTPGRIFRSTDQRTWYAASHLEVEAPHISRITWFNWTLHHCAEQDPSVNGGRLRSELVASPSSQPPKGPIRVWLDVDAELLLKRRKEGETRPTVPGHSGRWIDDDIWNDDEYGPCFTNRKLAAYLAEAGDPIAKHTFLYWRERGWLRFRTIPQHKRQVRGRVSRIVSCLKDADVILARRKRERDQARQGGKAIPSGWKSFNDLCVQMGVEKSKGKRISGDIMCLSIVLRRFRRERPAAAVNREGWDERRNRATKAGWHYDPAEFRRWLAGRCFRELAAGEREARTPKTEARDRARVHLATRFLQFTLTQAGCPKAGNADDPPPFPMKRFRRFLRTPPVGRVLGPSEVGVRVVDIRKWARQVGLNPDKANWTPLHQARAALKVEYNRKDNQGRYRWRLPGPVTIEASEFDVQIRNRFDLLDLPSVLPIEAVPRRRGGRPTKPETAKLKEECYKACAEPGKRAAQLLRLQARVGKEKVPNVPTMLLYARRHAEAEVKSGRECPWPPEGLAQKC